MREELPKIPTEDGKIHVLLVYVEGDTETYVYLFTSKKAVEEFVVDGIKKDWEEYLNYAGEDLEEHNRTMDNIIEEAVRCLRERGLWNDGEGNTYVYDEKEWTA